MSFFVYTCFARHFYCTVATLNVVQSGEINAVKHMKCYKRLVEVSIFLKNKHLDGLSIFKEQG